MLVYLPRHSFFNDLIFHFTFSHSPDTDARDLCKDLKINSASEN